MNGIIRLSSIEILTGLLMGGVPVWLTYKLSDYDTMIKSLSSMTPSDEIVIYLFALGLLHGLIIFINYQFLGPMSHKLEEEKTNIFTQAIKNVGFGLHGVYRTLLGAIPVAVAITLYIYHKEQGALALTILSAFMWFIALCICVGISKHLAK